MHYDVFNGDADGIIALLQLRLAEPKTSQLITGVKRDIGLLSQVAGQTDVSSVTVLDLSMQQNMPALQQLLAQQVSVFYCDHHKTGKLPHSEWLTSVIDLDAHTCTSLLINQQLQGAYAPWAIAGAFGDNQLLAASQLAAKIGLTADETDFLKELGTLINYNGYGEQIADLHYHPKDLYQALLAYPQPLMLQEDLHSPYYVLKAAFDKDMAEVQQIQPLYQSAHIKVLELPVQPWARRVSGVLGNELANQSPELAHAVLTLNRDQQSYTVSVRAPLSNRVGADEICSRFATGGGRKAAGGINQLPIADKQLLISRLDHYYR